MKLWVYKVDYERIQEIEDPELAAKRGRAIYKAKGYPDDWIEKRMRGIAMMLKGFIKIKKQLEMVEKSPVMRGESWSKKAAAKSLANRTF